MIHSGHGGDCAFQPVWRTLLIVTFGGSLPGGWFGPGVSGEELFPLWWKGCHWALSVTPAEP